MEQPKIHMLSDLNVDRDDCVIKVRIINMWRLPKNESPEETYSIEMILLDEHGNRIQGSVLHRFFSYFEKFLVDRACLLIKNPSLGNAPKKYRLVDNKNRVCLTPKTTVTKCEDFEGGLYGFSFKNFQDILDCDVNETSSIDIIGIIVKTFEFEDFINSDGKPSKKLPVLIQDLEGLKIYVSIWDSCATQLHDYLNSNQDVHHKIIVLQFAKFKIFNNRYSVSTSYGLSRLYINSDIDEIVSFKNRFVIATLPLHLYSLINADKTFKLIFYSLLDNSSQQTSSSLQISSSRPYSLKEDFLSNTEFNTIAELNIIVQAKSVIILGTIVSIQPNVSWYYPACKNCNHKAERNFNVIDGPIVYDCNNNKCNVQVVTTIPRFKIPLRIQDSTGVVSLTLFERDAKKIIKKTANELLDNYLKGIYEGFIPDELNELVGKKFAFKVEVSDFNVNKNVDVFGISKLTDNAEIMSQLEKNFNLEQTVDGESISLPSEETVNLKAAASFTADNETPLSSVAKPVAAMSDSDDTLKSSTTGIKRNLIDIYDVEEDAVESATKPKKDDTQDKLLVPKIEK